MAKSPERLFPLRDLGTASCPKLGQLPDPMGTWGISQRPRPTSSHDGEVSPTGPEAPSGEATSRGGRWREPERSPPTRHRIQPPSSAVTPEAPACDQASGCTWLCPALGPAGLPCPHSSGPGPPHAAASGTGLSHGDTLLPLVCGGCLRDHPHAAVPGVGGCALRAEAPGRGPGTWPGRREGGLRSSATTLSTEDSVVPSPRPGARLGTVPETPQTNLP